MAIARARGLLPVAAAVAVLGIGQATDFDGLLTRLADARPDLRPVAIEQYLNLIGRVPIVEGETAMFLAESAGKGAPRIVGDFNGGGERMPDDSALAGSMTRIDGTDWYYLRVRLPRGARVRYRIAVDGREAPDPRNPIRVESFGTVYSELRMPGYPSPRSRTIRTFRSVVSSRSASRVTTTSGTPRSPRGTTSTPGAPGSTTRSPTCSRGHLGDNAFVPVTESFYASLKSRRSAIEARYRELTPASARLFEQARAILPGGSTRDTVVRRPHPPFVREGAGAHLVDADGRSLVDFWFNATSLPLGHAHPRVVVAAQGAVALGSSFYAPTGLETDLAREIGRRLPGVARVRFTNSGTEAVMLAARMARAFTGRPLVAKFEGSYHGSWDDVAWSVGPQGAAMGESAAPAPVAATAGLVGASGRVLVLPFNNLEATARLLASHGARVAAVFVEPIANRMGLVQPGPGFLAGLRDLCDRHGALLVFDEVIAFRLGYRGAQGLAGVTPDLTTLGKLIGGGFPVGAVAGAGRVMDVSAPGLSDRVTHAGTFTANPVTMAAGLATLAELTPAAFDALNEAGERVRRALRRMCDGRPLQITGAGSLFKISATPRPIVDHRTSLEADAEWEETLSLALLCEGLFLAPRLHGCLSTATTPEDVDRLVETVHVLIRD